MRSALSRRLRELYASALVLASDLRDIGMVESADHTSDVADELRQAIKEIEQDANIHD